MFPTIEYIAPVENACMFQQKPKRHLPEPTKIDDREREWRALRPLTAKKKPIKENGFVAPINALEGMDRFVARIEAIKRLTDQQKRDSLTHRALIEQDKELATIRDEFRANGFTAISISSSSSTNNDDDIETSNIAENHLGITPYAFGIKKYVQAKDRITKELLWEDEAKTKPKLRPVYRDAVEASAILRRIDWERWDSENGPVISIMLTDNNGSIGVTTKAPWMAKKLSNEEIIALGRKIKTASGLTTIDELHNNRAMAVFYGAVGSLTYGVRTGEQPIEQTFDNLGAEELERKPEDTENPRAPVELGLHNLSEDWLELGYPPNQFLVLPEPHELELWPLTEFWES